MSWSSLIPLIWHSLFIGLLIWSRRAGRRSLSQIVAEFPIALRRKVAQEPWMMPQLPVDAPRDVSEVRLFRQTQNTVRWRSWALLSFWVMGSLFLVVLNLAVNEVKV